LHHDPWKSVDVEYDSNCISSQYDSDSHSMQEMGNEEDEQEEENEEAILSPEEKLQSSWYHRAMLGDEDRVIYDDYDAIIDWKVMEAEREHRFQEDEEDISDLNSNILGLEFAH